MARCRRLGYRERTDCTSPGDREPGQEAPAILRVESKKREFLVVGATGLVGSVLRDQLGDRAAGTSRKGGGDLFALDITDGNAVREAIEAMAPRVVVLAAALTAVDECERDPQASWAVNVGGTQNVAVACARTGARLVFFSSDYVFGEGGPHPITADPDPLNVYGRHKLEAEKIVLAGVDGALVVRTCNVYGYVPGGRNYAMSVLEALRAGRTVRAASDMFGNPTPAADLARAVLEIVEAGGKGVAHLAGPDHVDRVTWARRVAAAFGLDEGLIEPMSVADLGQPARRPRRGGLDSSATCAEFGVHLGGLDEGLAQMAARASAGQHT
ncbi:MAG: SDR family oxidoreductase [Deltaproteobacteria bacterium]|nr:MAG: SDR family oxidoreductase [Deltaproteobacteria bacterium]